MGKLGEPGAVQRFLHRIQECAWHEADEIRVGVCLEVRWELQRDWQVRDPSWKPVNHGTSSAPIGGLDVTVSVTSHGLFEKTTKSCTMTVKGDGSSNLGACEDGTFGLARSTLV